MNKDNPWMFDVIPSNRPDTPGFMYSTDLTLRDLFALAIVANGTVDLKNPRSVWALADLYTATRNG